MRCIAKLCIFLILLLALPALVNADPLKWGCNYGEGPENIDVTYTNENSFNKAKISELNLQKHPVIYPNSRLSLQLAAQKCFEYTVKVKDSSGAEVSQYTATPYSPFRVCDERARALAEQTYGGRYGYKFLTLFDFNAPSSHGNYSLDVYDDRGVLLTTGVMEVLNSSKIISSVQRTAFCRAEDSNYTLTLESRYPVVFEMGNSGKISVIIRGPDASVMRKMFEQVTMSVRSSTARISSTKDGGLVCSTGECRQDYSLTSSVSASVGVTVFRQFTPDSPKFAENGMSITILDVDKLREIKSSLDSLSSTSAEYAEYYRLTNQTEKARIWQDAHYKINSISEEISSFIPVLESRNFRISDVVNLISLVEKTPEEIDRIINSVSGVQNE